MQARPFLRQLHRFCRAKNLRLVFASEITSDRELMIAILALDSLNENMKNDNAYRGYTSVEVSKDEGIVLEVVRKITTK